MGGCLVGPGIVICGSDFEHRVVGRTRAAMWCFRCCKRARHNKVLLVEKLRYDEDGDLINGWYEPVLVLECPTCGEDNTAFPE